MTDAAAILEVRHVRLAEQATLRPASLGDGEEGVFVALDDPPPVRTVLSVVEGDRRRALEVAWVVEVAEREEVRGFYGRWVSEEALGRAMKVGTEHLEDGTPVVQPVVYDHSSAIDVSDAPVMAMPAPVMIVDDDTGVVDGDDGDEDGAERDDRHAEREEADERQYEAAETSDRAEAEAEAEAGSAETSMDSAEADQGDQTETSMDSAEAAEADQAETSTEAGEAPVEAADGDAGDSRSKGRKKRSRKRR